MIKRFLSKISLEEAALVEIRACFGCENVEGVDVELIADLRFDVNWRIASIRRKAGVVDWSSSEQARRTAEAIEAAQDKLRNLYSLRLNS